MIPERRLEVFLVAMIVVLGALGVRASYIPTYADQQLVLAEGRLGLDLDEPSKWFTAWSIGDGQAYALIAADPAGRRLGEHVGEPAYRFSRAGFGWLVAAASLGQQRLIPYGLAIAGVISLVGLLLLAVGLRERLGPKTWWLVLNPAIYLAFGGDTSESLGALLLALALASGSMWAAAGLGVTRPTYLLALWGRWRNLAAGVGAVALLGVYSLWRFGIAGFGINGGRLGWPIAGYVEEPSITGWVLVAAAITTLVIGVRRRDWSWVITALFVFTFGTDVTRDPVNAWRAAGLLPVLWAFGPGYQGRETRPVAKPAPASGPV